MPRGKKRESKKISASDKEEAKKAPAKKAAKKEESEDEEEEEEEKPKKKAPKEKPKKASKKSALDEVWTSSIPAELDEFLQMIRDNPSHVWSSAEAFKIAGELLETNPENWKGSYADPRILLLEMQGIDPDCDLKIQIFITKIATYKTLIEGHCTFKAEPLKAEKLLPVIKPLLKKKTWSDQDVAPVVELLKGVASIEAGDAGGEAINTWFEFTPRWEKYLDKHPKLRGELDPVYVIANLPAYPGFPGLPAIALPPVPPGAPLGPLAALNGSPFAWTFANQSIASFWCGAVRNFDPAIRLWMFTCAHACVYY